MAGVIGAAAVVNAASLRLAASDVGGYSGAYLN